MATTSEIVNDVLLENKLVQMWPDYPCLYDVRSAVFKNRDVRQLAMEEIAGKLDQNGTYYVGPIWKFVQYDDAYCWPLMLMLPSRYTVMYMFRFR